MSQARQASVSIDNVSLEKILVSIIISAGHYVDCVNILLSDVVINIATVPLTVMFANDI